jgi:DNA-binding MurR/RpiR family transcriptional regulator
MLVSGSRLRVKRDVHQASARIKEKGAKLISLTDNGDRELVERSEIAVLVPLLGEVAGSTLTLALLELLLAEIARSPREAPERRGPGQAG